LTSWASTSRREGGADDGTAGASASNRAHLQRAHPRGVRCLRDEAGTEYGGGGEYTLIEPPHRLALTWVWDDDPSNPQLIELEFSERDGVTTAVMINSGIPTDKRRDEQESGWHRCFDNLDRAWQRARPERRRRAAAAVGS
jgi:uncharacterized protein YndB with AHSA1/START domain